MPLINLLPCLIILEAILFMVHWLIKLDSLSQIKRSTYTSPVICNEEYISSCSGGNVSNNRRLAWHVSTVSFIGMPRKKSEIGIDQPIEVPNWPVKVGRES